MRFDLKLSTVVAAFLLLATPAVAQVITQAPSDSFRGPYRLDEAALSQPTDPLFGVRRIVVSGDRLFVAGSGAVYTYTRSGTVWTQGLSIVVNTPSFGRAMDFDAGRLIVGADGAAYIFEQQSGPDWVLVDTLPNLYGFSGTVAISGDRAAVTGGDRVAGTGASSVMVYARVNGQWTLETTIPVPVAWQVDLSGDILTVSGGLLDSETLSIFERGSDGVWRAATLISRFQPNSFAVGGPLVISGEYLGGAGFWERQPTGEWVLTQVFRTGFPEYGSISIDGDHVALGNGSQGGGAQIVGRTSTGGWEILANFRGFSERLGVQVSLSHDTLAVSDPRTTSITGTTDGFVYIATSDQDADGVRDGLDPCPFDGEDDCVPPQPNPNPQPQPQPQPDPPAPTPDPMPTPEPQPPIPAPEPISGPVVAPEPAPQDPPTVTPTPRIHATPREAQRHSGQAGTYARPVKQ